MMRRQQPSIGIRESAATLARVALLAAALAGAGVLAVSASGQVSVRVSDAEGFSPAEASAGAGAVTISVQNQSSAARLTLRITRENGERVAEIPVPEGAANWSTQVQLAAGNYLLTEVNTKGWACRLTVQ